MSRALGRPRCDTGPTHPLTVLKAFLAQDDLYGGVSSVREEGEEAPRGEEQQHSSSHAGRGRSISVQN